MKRIIIALLLLGLPGAGMEVVAQKASDSLDIRLARMPLASIFKEYPYKAGHTHASPADVGLSPRDLHPAFYGSFDWHSCVHGYWMMARLLQEDAQMGLRSEIEGAFDETFTRVKMQAEADYFDRPHGALFERTYGWAWLLKLDAELHCLARTSKDATLKAKATTWHEAMQPLTRKVTELWKIFLPKQTYPIRIGTHGNTAFGLTFAYDYALEVGDKAFATDLKATALRLFGGDKQIPAVWEPNGSDFFSPTLITAALMARVLEEEEYIAWLEGYLSEKELKHLAKRPVVSDLTDYQIVHLVGLSFSRAWCMAEMLNDLPKDHPYATVMKAALGPLYEHGLSQIFRSDYGGDHWLASFAVYCRTAIRPYYKTMN